MADRSGPEPTTEDILARLRIGGAADLRAFNDPL